MNTAAPACPDNKESIHIMKQTVTYLLLLLLLICNAEAADTGEEKFVMNPDGSIKIDNLVFRLTHWGKTWQNLSVQSSKSISDTARCNPSGSELRGVFHTSEGEFSLEESFENESRNQAHYSIKLESQEGVHSQYMALQVPLNATSYRERNILMDGVKIGFGSDLDEKKWNFSKTNVNEIVIQTDKGRLSISGKFAAQLQDDRIFGSPEWSLRIALEPAKGLIKNASLDFNLKYEAYSSIVLDISSAMNMAFADEKEGDKQGGWTDQGEGNDLRILPHGLMNLGGINFKIVNPAENNNKSCIVLRGREREYFPLEATVNFDKPQRGKYLYILHALAWPPKSGVAAGDITCTFDSGDFVEKQSFTFPVVSGQDLSDFWMPKSLPNGRVVWQGENSSAPVGLFMTRYELSGDPLRKITFTSRNTGVWMIVGASLSNDRIDSTVADSVTIKADQNWLPVAARQDVIKDSVIDFSKMLDAPAGKHGRLVCRNGSFEFEKRPGVPVRFYGTNIIYWVHNMENKYMDRMVDDMAATGYNMVRLHLFDFSKVIRYENGIPMFTSEYMERLDYLLSAFKKRGIYLTLDLFGTRLIKKGELPDYPEEEVNHKEFKRLVFVSDGAMENWKKFSAQLLNHKNQYTGLTWKEDPAITTISLINEDTIFNTSNNPFISEIYKSKFKKWLKDQKIDTEIAAKKYEFYWRRFLSDTYKKGFAEMSSFLRAEGVETPLTDQNFWSTVPLTLLRNNYDYVDNHFYWAHPVFPSAARVPARVMNSSATAAGAGGVSSMFPTRIMNKPFTVSEWDYVNPNSYNVEGAFLTGAYSALQDWSGLCRFAYSNNPEKIIDRNCPLTFFDSVNDPLRMLSERAAVLFFLRRDVQSSQISYPFLISSDYISQEENGDNYPTVCNRIGLIGKTGTVIGNTNSKIEFPAGTKAVLGQEAVFANRKDLGVPYIQCTSVHETLETMHKKGLINKEDFDPENDRFRSSSGELILDRRERTFSVVTAASEAFILPANKTGKAAFSSVSNRLCHAAFLIASVDGRTLAESERILILHLTDSKNSGIKFSGPEMTDFENNGTCPILIRRGEAEISLKKDLGNYKLYAVDIDGRRLGEIPLSCTNELSKFTAATALGNNIVAAYELIRNK